MTRKDKDILRALAGKVAEIAALPEQKITVEKWKRLNDMKSARPMVYIYQIPWWEMMNEDSELMLRTEDPGARKMEEEFLQTVYLWNHMRADMVVEPWYTVPKCIINDTGYGVKVERVAVESDGGKGVPSSHYRVQIAGEDDIEKIKDPAISCDYGEAENEYGRVSEILEGVLPVKKSGPVHFAFAPWDLLAALCDPGQILLDLAMRPAYIHRLIDRLVSAYCRKLDRMEELNLFSPGTGNHVVGNGGLGFTDRLPQPDCNPGRIRLRDMWSGGMSQIFSEVSPAMHEEFALQYEKRYLNRAGLIYYGCCEPLHRKVDIAAKHLPNLAKISMSPWADARAGAEAISGRFIFSFKPNPAFLASDSEWDRESARKQLREVLDITGGEKLEIILKDISTVRHKPRRLWEWAEMTMEMVNEYE